MKDSELRTRAKAFALHIIAVCDEVDTRKGRGVLVNQIVRSAASIGANIHEANYAASKADFINKFQIALKECYETDYWLTLFKDTHMITEDEYKDMFAKCSKIRKLLIHYWRGSMDTQYLIHCPQNREKFLKTSELYLLG